MASDHSGQLYWSKVGGRKTLNSRGQLGKEPPPTGDPTQGHPTPPEANTQPPSIIISTAPAILHNQETGSGPAAAPDPLQPSTFPIPVLQAGLVPPRITQTDSTIEDPQNTLTRPTPLIKVMMILYLAHLPIQPC